MERPRPVPPGRVVKNGVNSLAATPGVKPGPESDTVSRQPATFSSLSSASDTTTDPVGSAWAALWIRLNSALQMSSGSTLRKIGSSGASNLTGGVSTQALL